MKFKITCDIRRNLEISGEFAHFGPWRNASMSGDCCQKQLISQVSVLKTRLHAKMSVSSTRINVLDRKTTQDPPKATVLSH